MIRERRIPPQAIELYDREVLEQTTLLTLEQVADRINFSKSTVRTLIRTGELSAYSRHGTRGSCNGLRVLAADLSEYVRSIRVDRDKWGE